jgi:hypothetical protein
MNYELLGKLIHARHLPDDHGRPRRELYDILRVAEELRHVVLPADATDDARAEIKEQQDFYAKLLDEDE